MKIELNDEQVLSLFEFLSSVKLADENLLFVHKQLRDYLKNELLKVQTQKYDIWKKQQIDKLGKE